MALNQLRANFKQQIKDISKNLHAKQRKYGLLCDEHDALIDLNELISNDYNENVDVEHFVKKYKLSHKSDKITTIFKDEDGISTLIFTPLPPISFKVNIIDNNIIVDIVNKSSIPPKLVPKICEAYSANIYYEDNKHIIQHVPIHFLTPTTILPCYFHADEKIYIKFYVEKITYLQTESFTLSNTTDAIFHFPSRRFYKLDIVDTKTTKSIKSISELASEIENIEAEITKYKTEIEHLKVTCAHFA